MSTLGPQSEKDRQVPSKLSPLTSLLILVVGLALFGIIFSAYMGKVGILISCSLIVAAVATILLVDRFLLETGRRRN